MKFLTGFESAKEREAHSDLHGFATVGDSRTTQADATDCDINVIMKRYARTGQFVPPARLPEYGDFSGISDFRTALEAVRSAEQEFMRLDPRVRSHFENDPQAFLEACEDPERLDELADLGLLNQEALDAHNIAKAAKVKENPTSGEPVSGSGRAASPARRDGDGGSRSRSRSGAEGGEDH